MMRELRIHISSAFDPLSSAHKGPHCILEEFLGGHGVFCGVNKGGKEEEREITLGNYGVSLLHQRDLVVNLLVRTVRQGTPNTALKHRIDKHGKRRK